MPAGKAGPLRRDRGPSEYGLPETTIGEWLDEARRLLVPGGNLCIVSLTDGVGLPSRVVSWLWGRVHALSPRLVGGCRPLKLRDLISRDSWREQFRRVVTAWGVPSEVLVATPAPSGARDGAANLQV